MSDPVAGKPSGKILFGIDYLNVMRFMELPDEKEEYDESKKHVVDAVARLFLLQWDFSVEEIDEANTAFWEKVNSKTLDETIITVVDRIVDFLKGDKKDQERFLVEVAAVAQLDDTFLDSEGFMRDVLQSKFDFRPSEITEFYKKGWYWRVALDYVGERYIEAAKAKQKTN
jgi:hypothetical protein